MRLDFIVIGAQKGGTTSLWRYLSPHPRLCMPTMKEAAFFTESDDLERLDHYMRIIYADAPADALLGKASPDYMVGQPGDGVEVVATRIARTFPEAKLIALLRDPIERATSSYMMAVRRGQETRSFDAALDEQLEPAALERSRVELDPANSYIVAGEYGRILEVYRAAFPPEQLLVAFTDELARDPGRALDAVLDFLGLPAGFRPPDLDLRHFSGGTRKLLDSESERLLFKFVSEEMLPKMSGHPHANLTAFQFFYETWNVARDASLPSISADLRDRLEEHYRSDARRLEALGVPAPWVAKWGTQAS